MEILKIKDLRKKFTQQNKSAVDGVSFEVEKGELFSIVGESGCGKTTLLRLIAGFEIPDAGEIFINSQSVADQHTLVEPEHRGVGMVFQDYALFPHLNVYKNIRFGLEKLPKKEQEKRINALLELVGLQGLEKRFPHELSGGQQQRVALARSLAANPNLLLLDEPFSNLDDSLKSQVRDDTKSILKQSGCTAIFVSHDTKDALAISDRIAVMKDGKIEQIGASKSIYNHPKTCYVANFFGKTNLLPAVVKEGGFETPIGFIAANNKNSKDKKLILSIRPDGFAAVSRNESNIKGTIKKILFHGEKNEVTLSVDSKDSLPYELTLSLDVNRSIKIDDVLHVKPDEKKIQVIHDL